MIKEGRADGEKFFLRFDAPDCVFEFRLMTLDDINEVAFHLLNMLCLDEGGVLTACFLVEHRNVF